MVECDAIGVMPVIPAQAGILMIREVRSSSQTVDSGVRRNDELCAVGFLRISPGSLPNA